MNSDFQPRSTEGRNSDELNFQTEKKASGNRNTFNRNLRSSEVDKEFNNQYSEYYYKNKDGNLIKKDKQNFMSGYSENNTKNINNFGDHNYRDFRPKNSFNQRRNNKTSPNQDNSISTDNSNQFEQHSNTTGYYNKSQNSRLNNSYQYRSSNSQPKQSKAYNIPHNQNVTSNIPLSTNKIENISSNLDLCSNEQTNTNKIQFPINSTEETLSPSTLVNSPSKSLFTQSNFEIKNTGEQVAPKNENFSNFQSKNNDSNITESNDQFDRNYIKAKELQQYNSELESENSSPQNYTNSNTPTNSHLLAENFDKISLNESKTNLKSEQKYSSKDSTGSNLKSEMDNNQQETSDSPLNSSKIPPSIELYMSNDKSSISTMDSHHTNEKNQTSNSTEQSPSTSSSNFADNAATITSSSQEVPKSSSGLWKLSRSSYLQKHENVERQTKSLLNKLTIEKFPTILEQLSNLEETIKDEIEMQNFVNLIVGKAVSEPEWSEMYADLCLVLFWRSPYLSSPTQNSFRLALLSKIETEFIALPKTLDLPEEKKKLLDPPAIELEIKRLKNYILGVITLIGELYQRKLLAYKVLHQVVLDLVINTETPHEHIIECFLQLICTTGYYIDQNESLRKVLDLWFGRLKELYSKDIYSKRLKYVIQNVFDLRKANWLRKLYKDKAKSLSEMRGQLQKEDYIGGATHAASYGNIVTVGKPTNATTNDHYATYLREQEERFIQKRQPLAKAKPPINHH